MVKIDITNAVSFSGDERNKKNEEKLSALYKVLVDGTGKGNDFLGWLKLPATLDPLLIQKIQNDAAKIQKHSQIFVVIGIGGSYLGARAVIDCLSHPFSSVQKCRNAPLVIYAGNNLSEDYHAGLLEILDQNDYSVAVISKSGTTTEPAVAFRIIKAHLEKKYGKKEAAGRIFAVTDAHKGALKKLADEEGYSTYVIPDDVGGRYSVLTPVGLLPIAVAGFDIRQFVAGALAMESLCGLDTAFEANPAAVYAATRNELYKSGKKIEILVNYHPKLHFIAEWWKQLY